MCIFLYLLFLNFISIQKQLCNHCSAAVVCFTFFSLRPHGIFHDIAMIPIINFVMANFAKGTSPADHRT